MRAHLLLAACLVGAAIAGCTAAPQQRAPVSAPLGGETVNGGPGTGGGNVGNTPPTWQSFAASPTSVDNSGGGSTTLTGQVFDANGETDGMTLTVTVGGVLAAATHAHTVTSNEADSTTEPAGFGSDGFKVWTGTGKNDGVLLFRYKQTVPIGTPAGTATFAPSVSDAHGAAVNGTAASVTVTVFSEITVASAPVDAAGSPTSANWGLWSAAAGAGNVDGTNFVKLTNTGQKPSAQVVIDFTDAAFLGQSNPNFSIPINGNVQFAWWQGNASAVPSQGAFTYGAASSDGSVTVQFNGLGNVIYVKYRIVQLPQVLAAQSYAASYTATEL